MLVSRGEISRVTSTICFIFHRARLYFYLQRENLISFRDSYGRESINFKTTGIENAKRFNRPYNQESISFRALLPRVTEYVKQFSSNAP